MEDGVDDRLVACQQTAVNGGTVVVVVALLEERSLAKPETRGLNPTISNSFSL